MQPFGNKKKSIRLGSLESKEASASQILVPILALNARPNTNPRCALGYKTK